MLFNKVVARYYYKNNLTLIELELISSKKEYINSTITNADSTL
jgi:hypothetical protein